MNGKASYFYGFNLIYVCWWVLVFVKCDIYLKKYFYGKVKIRLLVFIKDINLFERLELINKMNLM